MKHKIDPIFYALFFGFLLGGTSFAAPVGNPGGPVLLEGHYPTKFSLEAETVLSRKLKSTQPGKPFFKGVFYTAKVSLYNNKKIDLYCTISAAKGRVKSFTDAAYMIESKTGGSVGCGLSYVFHEKEFMGGILRTGADAKFRYFNPNVEKVVRYKDYITTTDRELSLKEWQTSLGLSYQYKKFVPYAGIKYSDVVSLVKFTDGPNTYIDKSMRSKHKVGIFYGLDILLKDNFSLNIEGRNIDENAVNAGLNLRF